MGGYIKKYKWREFVSNTHGIRLTSERSEEALGSIPIPLTYFPPTPSICPHLPLKYLPPRQRGREVKSQLRKHVEGSNASSRPVRLVLVHIP